MHLEPFFCLQTSDFPVGQPLQIDWFIFWHNSSRLCSLCRRHTYTGYVLSNFCLNPEFSFGALSATELSPWVCRYASESTSSYESWLHNAKNDTKIELWKWSFTLPCSCKMASLLCVDTHWQEDLRPASVCGPDYSDHWTFGTTAGFTQACLLALAYTLKDLLNLHQCHPPGLS